MEGTKGEGRNEARLWIRIRMDPQIFYLLYPDQYADPDLGG